jgi:hypothetical protein
MKKRQSRVSIEPVTDADIEQLVALAREIWYAHYPAIIGTAQIEYMLGQRYNYETMRAELRQSGLWWDKLTVGGEMAGFASYFLAQDAGGMPRRSASSPISTATRSTRPSRSATIPLSPTVR